MGKVIYEGREYYEPELETQQACAECDLHTFRYYPKERLMIASDYFVKNFHVKKFYPQMPQSLAKDIVAEEYWETLFEMYDKIHSGVRKSEIILKTKHGTKTSRVTVTTIKYDNDNKPEVCVGIVEDVSEEMRVNHLAEALSKDYSSIFYVDIDENKVYPYRMNAHIKREYGELLNTLPSFEQMSKMYVENSVIEEYREEMRREINISNLISKLKDKEVYMHDYKAEHDGVVNYYRMKVVNISSGHGEIHQIVVGFADVNFEKQQELERYAYVDFVTGGDNYTRFKERLETSGSEGSLITMDIHDFKIINSICGVKQGDNVLRAIWQRINRWLLEGDSAGHISADHFVIFLTEIDENIISERLFQLGRLIEEISLELSVPQIIPYFGVAKLSGDKKIESAVTEANEAKHQVKDRKDMNFFFYNIKDTTRLLEEKHMEDAFEEAIESKRFEVWYQPKYSPVERKLVGAEALVRWRGVDGKLILPAKFIPLFERNGMIRLLDEYVFRTVCEQQKKWKDAGLKIVPISINLSRASLYFQHVVENYKKIIEEVDIYPQWVPIEITESATIDNKDIRQLADMFFEAGFPLHMDDFGTGYSSLASLNVMHFDTLKIDKSLIDYIGNYGGDRLLVHTIALAKELGMTVVAEGVENLTQVGFLKELRCDSIQGYVYSKPLPLEEFTKELQNTESVGMIGRRRNFDLSQRNACYLNELIYSAVGEYNDLFKASGRRLIPDLPHTDEAVYVEVENFKFMLEVLFGFCLKNAKADSKVVFTVTKDESTKADYCSYEMVIKVPEVEENLPSADDLMKENVLMSAREIIDRHSGHLIIYTDNNILTVVIRIGMKLGNDKEISILSRKRTVLLVDDNALNREQAKEVLKQAGFLVETAINGDEAINIVRESEEKHFSLILMDIIMPEKDGFEATMEIRQMDREDIKRLPIVALSSNTMDVSKKKAVECGMDGYVEKPLGTKELADIMKYSRK